MQSVRAGSHNWRDIRSGSFCRFLLFATVAPRFYPVITRKNQNWIMKTESEPTG